MGSARTWLSVFLAVGLLSIGADAQAKSPARDEGQAKARPEAKSKRTRRNARQAGPSVQVHATIEPQVSVQSSEESYRHSESTREIRYRKKPPPPPQQALSDEPSRDWHLGANLGTGPMIGNLNSAGLSGSLDVYAGLRIGRFALQGEFWLQYRDYFSTGEGLFQRMGMITAQLWLDDKLWIKAGLGGAALSQDGYDTAANGSSLMAATGFDLLDTRHVVLNAHVKAGTGIYRERGVFSTISAGVGFTWY